MLRRLLALGAILALIAIAPVVQARTLDTHSGRATGDSMGPMMTIRQTAWHGYYDGHKDTYLNTDVSSKAMATAMHINYSGALARTPLSATPAIYLVSGRAAANQIAVFGSQLGESDYSPLWHEVSVQWKAGAAPKLLTSDNQILSLAKKGKLTVRQTHTILNCPIIHVGM